MHALYELWLRLFAWLIKDGASRATFCLVVITGWYAILTWRMARAMAHQTRALVQPILSIEITVDEFFPTGGFEVKNVGTQPFVILDMLLQCRIDTVAFEQGFQMYERHILPPDDSIAFQFDMQKKYEEKGFRGYAGGGVTANVTVVVADLTEQTVQTYRMFTYWRTLLMTKGLPWRVRRRIWIAPFRQGYYRLLYRFKPPLFFPIEPPKPKTQKSEKPTPQADDSPDGR